MPHSSGFLKLVESAKKNIRECTIDDVRAKLDQDKVFHLIDVREDREFARARVTGAVHMGRGILERDIEQVLPDKDASIILYCGGGFRSALATESIQTMGYRNVVSMDGGFRAWAEAGYPIETD